MTRQDHAAECCLVLMLKAPQRSKRRLGAIAATVAAHLYECAAEDMHAWPGPRCWAPADAADRRWLAARLPADAWIVNQPDGNLGDRIGGIGAVLAASGRPLQLFIGIDCPEIDAGYLAAAAAALARHDAVIGPAADGGAVVIGTRSGWPELASLPWSTPGLGRALVERFEDSGRDVARLEPLADVDSVADLAALSPRLAADSRPARRALCRWLTLHEPQLRIGA